MSRSGIGFCALLAVAAGALLSAAERQDAEHPPVPTEGVAVLQPSKGHKAHGVITLTERDGHVRIEGEVRGLTPGKHGFHIHEFGDLRASDGSSAGDHYAPEGHRHGAPGDEEHHAGDLGNITADESGVARVDIEADWLKLHFVIGRAMVVHEKEDDLQSQPSGNAGARIAVGVIGFAQVKEGRTARAE